MSGRQPDAGTTRESARRELIGEVVELGFPEEFGEVIADELGGEASMRRMASYLRGVQPHRPEEIADELLAIVAERRSWVERKMSERAEASVTAFLNRPRDPFEDG